MIEKLMTYVEEDGQKNFVIAVILSIFIYGGFGNAYNELYHRFGIQFLVSWIVGLITVILAYCGMANSVISLIFIVLAFILYLYFIFDAYRCSRAINRSEPIPKLFGKLDVDEDNKSSVIAMLFSLICTGLGNSYNGLHDRFLLEFTISLIIGWIISALVTVTNLPLLTGSYVVTSALNFLQFIGHGNTTVLALTIIGILLNLYFILDTYLCKKALDDNKTIPKLFGVIKIN